MNRRETGTVDPRPPGVSIDLIALRKTYVCQNGRPLDELRSTEETLKQQRERGVLFDLIDHGHKDLRRQFPKKKMNISAFTEITENKSRLLDGLAWLNHSYFNGKPQDVIAFEAYEMATIATWIPGYLVLRAEKPVESNNLPDVVGDLFKAGQGLQSSAKVLLTYDKSMIVHPENFYQAAKAKGEDGNPLLVTGEVCPAPHGTIVESANALLTQEGGDQTQSELNQYISAAEFGTLKAFSNTVNSFIQTNLFVQQAVKGIDSKLRVLHAAGVPPKDEVFAQVLQVRENVIKEAQANRATSEIEFNRLLGRNPNTITT